MIHEYRGDCSVPALVDGICDELVGSLDRTYQFHELELSVSRPLDETWRIAAYRPGMAVPFMALMVDRKTSGWRRPWRVYEADEYGNWGHLEPLSEHRYVYRAVAEVLGRLERER